MCKPREHLLGFELHAARRACAEMQCVVPSAILLVISCDTVSFCNELVGFANGVCTGLLGRMFAF